MDTQHKFKIYTKTGDDGTSGLIGGTRVEKFDQRLEAYGTVDELNSWIGLILSGEPEDQIQAVLKLVQNKLFDIGSHLATDFKKTNSNLPACTEEDIRTLEEEIDRMQSELPDLKNFILPGGSALSSYAHLARTVCRRSERRINQINTNENVQKNVLVFINRLSDYLFVLARYINYKSGIGETIWNRSKS